MIDFFNWFLDFLAGFVHLLFGMYLDTYSFGDMLLAVFIVGVVIMGTISSVAILAKKR